MERRRRCSLSLFVYSSLELTLLTVMAPGNSWGAADGDGSIKVYRELCTAPEAAKITRQCHFTTMKLDCDYISGNIPRPTVSDLTNPGRVKENFRVSHDMVRRNTSGQNACSFPVFNISWSFPMDASAKFVEGFQLVIKYQNKNVTETLVRTILIDQHQNLSGKQLSGFQYYDDCIIIPQLGAKYNISIFSLPQNVNQENAISVLLHKPMEINDLNSEKGAYQTCPNFTDSANWVTMLWPTPIPEKNRIKVCFYPASRNLNFSTYIVELMYTNSTRPKNLYAATHQFVTANDQSSLLCAEFTVKDTLPEQYKIWVSAHNGTNGEMTPCRKNGINGQAVHCVRSQVMVNLTLEDKRITDYLTTTSQLLQIGSPHNVGIIIAVIIGVTIISVLIGVLFAIRKCIWSKPKTKCALEDQKRREFKSNDLPSVSDVLIIAARDNAAHCEVVCKFASFLREQYQCNVYIDEWSRPEIAEHSSAQWLLNHISQIFHIIIIHSQAGYRQYSALLASEDPWDHKEQQTPYEDLFLVALNFVLREYGASVGRQRDSTGNRRTRIYYHVYFSQYTSPKYIVDMKFGLKYNMMLNMDDLFLHLHGKTKSTSNGDVESIDGIPYREYFANKLRSAEGTRLKAALQLAAEYHKKNSDWFEKTYKRTKVMQKNKSVLMPNVDPTEFYQFINFRPIPPAPIFYNDENSTSEESMLRDRTEIYTKTFVPAARSFQHISRQSNFSAYRLNSDHSLETSEVLHSPDSAYCDENILSSDDRRNGSDYCADNSDNLVDNCVDKFNWLQLHTEDEGFYGNGCYQEDLENLSFIPPASLSTFGSCSESIFEAELREFNRDFD